jgi:hypothetical protein
MRQRTLRVDSCSSSIIRPGLSLLASLYQFVVGDNGSRNIIFTLQLPNCSAIQVVEAGDVH